MTHKRFRGRNIDDLSSESDGDASSPTRVSRERVSQKRNGSRTTKHRSRSYEATSSRQVHSHMSRLSTGNRTRSHSTSRSHGDNSSRQSVTQHNLVDEEDSDDQTEVSATPPSDTTMCEKKGRGPAIPNKDWGTGEKLILEWNEYFHPVGRNVKILAAQLGSYARDGDLFPLTKTSWDAFDEKLLNNIWNDILDNTNAPDVPACKKYCMESIHAKWRLWKYRVKLRFYLPYETDEERKQHRPPNVRLEDWEKLIKYFGKESVKELAKLNRECRGHPVASNRTGRTSHDCIRDSLKKQNKSTNRIAVWKKSREKKDGTYDENDGAKDLVDQLNSRLGDLPEDESNDPKAIDKVFVDVIGEDGHGRVRTMGVGVTPSMMRSRSLEYSYKVEVDKILAEHEVQIANLRAEFREEVKKEREAERERVFEEVMTRLRNAGIVSSLAPNQERTADERTAGNRA